MPHLSPIQPLSILVASLAGFAVGGLWYGPLFGHAWLQASGVRAEQVRAANRPALYGSVLLLNLVAATALSQFIGTGRGGLHGLILGAAAGALLVGTAFAVSYRFEFRSLRHWSVNAGYQTLIYAVMGVILGAWN